MAGYRSGFERTIATNLQSRGVEFEYETIELPYKLELNYIPDLYFPKFGFYVEVKGYLDYEDRRKHLAIKKEHPDIDIRFVFMRADQKMPKLKSTHAQWATKNGYLFGDGKIPEEWTK